MVYCRKLVGKPALALALVAMCPLAAAGIQPRGDPIPGGSWGQGFDYDVGTRSGLIDLVAVMILDGGPLESPTFRQFDAADWSILYENPSGSPTLASAGAFTNPVAALSFDLWFDSEPADPVSLAFAAWHPDEATPFEAYRLNWDGDTGRCVWVVAEEPPPINLTRVAVTSPPIPVPGAVVLGAIGLGGLLGLRRRLS